MELTILGASGATGQELTRQALERGHTVTAVARTPERIAAPSSERLTRRAGDVRDPASIMAALRGSSTILSGLGITSGDQPGALLAGAEAALQAHPERIIWLGAFGTGASAQAAGWFTRNLLKAVMRAELPDKVGADTLILNAGGTVFHAGMLSNGPPSSQRRTVSLADAPHRLFPARVSRATVAAAMLDEADTPRFPGATAVPLEG